jgi:hypothetical protein
VKCRRAEEGVVQRTWCGVDVCLSEVVVPHDLTPELNRLSSASGEVLDNRVGGLELIEQKLPVTAQQHHGRHSARLGRWSDAVGRIVVVDHDKRGPVETVAVDSYRPAACAT